MTHTRSGRALIIRLLVTGAALSLWFWTQSLIGKHALPTSGIGDQLLLWTAPINSYLYEHHRAANVLLISSSAIIDLEGILLLGLWIFGPNIRPFLGLLLVLGLRQLMQALVALPTPENMIWHYPGFPSLLVTYSVGNDYYFSGHTAIAVLGAAELVRLGRPRVTGLAALIVVFEVTTVLILRAHYTMDVFTGAIAALYVASVIGSMSPAVDRVLDKL